MLLTINLEGMQKPVSPCKDCKYKLRHKDLCLDSGCEKPYWYSQTLHNPWYKDDCPSLGGVPIHARPANAQFQEDSDLY